MIPRYRVLELEHALGDLYHRREEGNEVLRHVADVYPAGGE